MQLPLQAGQYAFHVTTLLIYLNLQPQPQKIIGHAFCACVVMYFLVSS